MQSPTPENNSVWGTKQIQNLANLIRAKLEVQFRMSKKSPKQTVKIRYVTLDTSFTPFRSWIPPEE